MKEATSSFWSLAAVADYLSHPRVPFSLQQESVFNYWRLRFKNRYLTIKKILAPGKKPGSAGGCLPAGFPAFAQSGRTTYAA